MTWLIPWIALSLSLFWHYPTLQLVGCNSCLTNINFRHFAGISAHESLTKPVEPLPFCVWWIITWSPGTVAKLNCCCWCCFMCAAVFAFAFVFAFIFITIVFEVRQVLEWVYATVVDFCIVTDVRERVRLISDISCYEICICIRICFAYCICICICISICICIGICVCLWKRVCAPTRARVYSWIYCIFPQVPRVQASSKLYKCPYRMGAGLGRTGGGVSMGGGCFKLCFCLRVAQ